MLHFLLRLALVASLAASLNPVRAQTQEFPPCPTAGPSPNEPCWRQTGESDSLLTGGVSDPLTEIVAQHTRGSVALQAGDFAQAAARFDTLMALDPSNHEWATLRGRAAYLLGDDTGALRYFRAAIGLDPDDPTAYALRASLKDELGDTGGAVRDYRRAASLDPDDLQVMQALIGIYERREMWPDALRLAERSIQIKGDRCPNCYMVAGVLNLRMAEARSSPEYRRAGCARLSTAGELGIADAYEWIRRNCR